MDSFLLWAWLVVIPCDVAKGERCTAVVHDTSKSFFHEKDCLAARDNILADFREMRLLRYRARCHKVNGPFLEPLPQAAK
jgi:hypothetical protein